ncbi:MAG: RES family NAD+ phosphorylase [Acidobacteria bacterium]|nr:RES family NAD+ phosphorylase [Acidobacteriota bacterium]
MRVFRICKKKFAQAAFSGEGSRLYAGRWNPAGVSMVYTSASLALASVELFVHLDPSVAPNDLVSIAADIPDDLAMETIAVESLPRDWRSLNHASLRKRGADWIRAGRTVAMRVPSAVVTGEWNVLLNPAHGDFTKIVQQKPLPFRFDDRMFR